MSSQYLLPDDYKSDIKPGWCPGCSVYGIMAALTRAFSQKQINPLTTNLVSGIGCSSRMPLYFQTFGMHTLHGRAIPVAIGSRLSRPDIKAIVIGGDGDLFSIGTNHFVHAARKNFNITVICIDNRIYAMTKNQASPTSTIGYKGTLTPYGKLSAVLNVVEFSISCGATFVARAHCNSPDHLQQMISCAMDHNGFSLVHVLAPCKTFTRESFVSENCKRVIDINKELAHDPTDRAAAMTHAAASVDFDSDENSKIPIGIYWKHQSITFEEQVKNISKNHQQSDVHSIIAGLQI